MDKSYSTLPHLLTPEDLADYLNVPLRTIEGWHCRQKGPSFFRFGKHVRYPEDRVELWLGQCGV